jgi:hypothetical protein
VGPDGQGEWVETGVVGIGQPGAARRARKVDTYVSGRCGRPVEGCCRVRDKGRSTRIVARSHQVFLYSLPTWFFSLNTDIHDIQLYTTATHTYGLTKGYLELES